MPENQPINVNLPESTGEVLNAAYDDLAHPAATALGEAAGTTVDLINTLLTPIKMLNSIAKIKANKFIEDYQKKVSAIPKDKYCEANPALIGPMTEHVKHKLTEDVLREHYLTLMASVSNSDNLCKPLLSFDNVLNQLTPIELNMLEHLFKETPKQNFPLAHIKRVSNTGFSIVYQNLTDINFENLSSDAIGTILSNYERLGLIEISMMNFVEPSSERYKYVKESPVFDFLNQSLVPFNLLNPEANFRLDFEKGSFTTTPFGESFIQTIFK